MRATKGWKNEKMSNRIQTQSSHRSNIPENKAAAIDPGKTPKAVSEPKLLMLFGRVCFQIAMIRIPRCQIFTITNPT